jgi:hypothetical protein
MSLARPTYIWPDVSKSANILCTKHTINNKIIVLTKNYVRGRQILCEA